MKVANISAVLLSALFSIAVSAAPLGEVSSEMVRFSAAKITWSLRRT